MASTLNIPWERYGLIAELAERLRITCPQFGKTALQKLVYLLQEVYYIDCGYEFSLYTYGPYTSQLQQDLDLVEVMDGVKIARVMSGTGGYCILPGDKKEVLRKKAAKFLDDPKVTGALEQLVGDFGSCWAKDLELASTIVYVERDLKRANRQVSLKQLSHTIHELKPKFDPSEIQPAISSLQTRGFIALAS